MQHKVRVVTANMIDRAQLPFLLELVHDDSPVVRERVAEALAEFGPDLERELDLLPAPPDVAVRVEMEGLLRDHQFRRILSLWSKVLETAGDLERLERGLGVISELQSGPHASERLGERLDALAESYRARHPVPHPLTLARFLFGDGGLRGEREHYYDPANSDVLKVLEKGSGVPITLACVLVLVGRRLDMPVEGCSYPGHFLARVWLGSEPLLVDCFDGGRVVSAPDLAARNPVTAGVLDQRADAGTILARVLRNLIRAWDLAGSVGRVELPLRMVERLEQQARPPAPRPAFALGTLVRHRRYNYRGVVVEVDLTCQASESWHRGNEALPDRNQPWYYVLVHGTTHVTYAAQASLEEDPTGESVAHPFVPHFFSRFEQGHYVRNDRPWPGR